jgi:hypothetical protein
MAMRKIKHPGDMIADMHGGNLQGVHTIVSYNYGRLSVRNVIEWRLPDADDDGTLRAQVGGRLPRLAVLDYFVAVARAAGQQYINKYLVVLGEANDDGWWPAGYLYDGRRVGFCEVKQDL